MTNVIVATSPSAEYGPEKKLNMFTGMLSSRPLNKKSLDEETNFLDLTPMNPIIKTKMTMAIIVASTRRLLT